MKDERLEKIIEKCFFEHHIVIRDPDHDKTSKQCMDYLIPAILASYVRREDVGPCPVCERRKLNKQKELTV